MDTISQQSLHDELLNRLRKMIIDGQFVPGDKIPERQLCDQFGVSRTPLREALKVLAAEGLVQLAPNRGAMVAALTPNELDECLPMVATVESLAGELACSNITDEEIAGIKSSHAGMLVALDTGDLDGLLAMNRRFHRGIVAAARNPLLAAIHDSLFFRVGRNRLAPHRSKEKTAEALADHDNIIEALEARQSQRLAGLLQRHIVHTYRKGWRSGPLHISGTM
ncbi:MAG: GntR family transcriptional regulator [Candidatus Binatota bacterium]|nr:GntR family transcriptional regulator [Candidatus Binatota bacterium]